MDAPEEEWMWQLWIASLIILVLPFTDNAPAMMLEIPLEELVREADLIVVGAVESVKSQKGGEMIFSLAKIRVKRVLKGKVPSEGWVTVEFQGGSVAEETLVVEDSPDYKPGEEVVAFLKKLSDSNKYTTVGLFQGKHLIKEGTVLPENLPLETFLEQIEALLHKEKTE
ncbi:MAG TPA: hypothetical protein ACFYD3_02670 [Candidatus Hypogeohydataceae bacterium YC41]